MWTRQIRWERAIRVLAVGAAAIAALVALPSLLSGGGPPPPPSDVGLATLAPPPAAAAGAPSVSPQPPAAAPAPPRVPRSRARDAAKTIRRAPAPRRPSDAVREEAGSGGRPRTRAASDPPGTGRAAVVTPAPAVPAAVYALPAGDGRHEFRFEH